MRKLIPLVILLAAGCASVAAPPGGPELTTPPELVTVTPDSGTIGRAPPAVVFRFDRVVSERPRAAAELAYLFIISPSDGMPRVDWRRSALTVRPRRGWQPNTVYTVTMLPGVTDLRGNATVDRATTVFSTGGEIPDTRIDGIVFDWIAGRPAARATVEAVRLPDSTVFVARADSTGSFSMRHLPEGAYEVRGFQDLNNNRALDPREPWDSTSLTLRDSATVELLAFVHDSVPPRMSGAQAVDSLTLRVTFDRAIDPAYVPAAAAFRLVGTDSVEVGIREAMQRRAWDEARAARGDTAAPPEAAERPPAPPPAPGAAPRAPLPQPSRPRPGTDIVLTLARPVEGGATYRLRADGVRGLLGHASSVERVFTIPRAQAVPPTPAEPPPADTIAPRDTVTPPRPPAAAVPAPLPPV